MPKQLVELAGRPILDWSVERLAAVCAHVVVAVPATRLEALSSHFAGWAGVDVVAGGATRWQSVRRAFAVTSGEPGELVAVHDGARPALAREDLEAVVRAAAASSAAVLGRPAADTIKRVERGRVVETLDRAALFRAETPQVFSRRVLERALALAEAEGLEPTDESTLVERLGDVAITAVAARHPNPKVTDAGDLERLAPLLARPVAETP